MNTYYLELALQNLRRHVWLTTLIVLAISLGLGSSMTVYTILRAMTTDPISWKSDRLLTPQIDNFGPENRLNGSLLTTVSYKDVVQLKREKRALRQAGMFAVGVTVAPENSGATPVFVEGRATHGDFFAMFDVPFREGRAWTEAEDDARANVVVITRPLAERLFAGGKAEGGILNVEGRDYRVVGVTGKWEPSPRFYDVGPGGGAAYDPAAQIFLPLETALERQIQSSGSITCMQFGGDLLASECVWLQYWMEAASTSDVPKLREYLAAYGAEQQRSGRLSFNPQTALHTVPEWLALLKVAPDQVRIASWVAFGFLLVCLVNAAALMLARASRRAGELSLRRALGASRRHLFLQGVWESLLVGVVGGVLGLVWTAAGLGALRGMVPEAIVSTTAVKPAVLGLTLLLALGVTLLAGLYPAWRSARTAGALRLKSL